MPFRPTAWRRRATPAAKGASLVEYAMVAGLISVASIGAVFSTGKSVEEILCHTAHEIQSGLYTAGVGPAPGAPCLEIADAGTPTPGGGAGTGGGEGSGGGEAPGAGDGTDDPGAPGTGGGESATEANPADNADELMLAFRNFTYPTGRSYTHRQVRVAEIAPAHAYVFSITAPNGAVLPGTIAACVGSTCATPVASGTSSIEVPANTRFSLSFSFVPGVSVLDALDVPLDLTLRRADQPTQAWAQSIRIRRAASSVGISEFSVPDLTLDPGYYLTSHARSLGARFSYAAPEGARWSLTLTPLDTGKTIQLSPTTESTWTTDAPLTWTTTDGRVGVRAGRMDPNQRYDALERSYAITIASLDDPTITASDTFTIRRAEKLLGDPTIDAQDTTTIPGMVGTVSAPYTYTGQEDVVITLTQTDAEGVPLPKAQALPITMTGASLYTGAHDGHAAYRTSNPSVSGNISVKVPSGATLLADTTWHFLVRATSTANPARTSSDTFTITRPASTFAPEVSFDDMILVAGARGSTGSVLQSKTVDGVTAMDRMTLTARLLGDKLDSTVRICVGNNCSTLTTTASETGIAGANTVSIQVSPSIIADDYKPMDFNLELSLAPQGSTAAVTQTIRVIRPAAEVTPPALDITPLTSTTDSAEILVPFTFRAQDTVRTTLARVSGDTPDTIRTYSATAAGAKIGPDTVLGSRQIGSGTTTQYGLVGLTSDQANFDTTYTLSLAPKAADSTFDATKSTTQQFRVVRTLPQLSLAGAPGNIAIPGGSMASYDSATFPLALPESGAKGAIRLRVSYSNDDIRLALCDSPTSCGAELSGGTGTTLTPTEGTKFVRLRANKAAGSALSTTFTLRLYYNQLTGQDSTHSFTVTRAP